MELAVVGAGVGRTGTHSLKIALEQLLGAPCHHMLEILGDPTQVPAWIDAIEGRPVDWSAMLARYRAIVDWPGGAFWPELSAAYPDALVLLSVRDPEAWYRSASNTIFLTFDNMPPELAPWMDEVRKLLHDRFSDRFDDPTAMMDAFVRHNDSRAQRGTGRAACSNGLPATAGSRSANGSGYRFPAEPFPVTNTTDEFREMIGIPPLT